MSESTSALQLLLAELTAHARRKGWSDAEWARRSGLPKETLCRLRSRATCDLATLAALAEAAGVQLGVAAADGGTTEDGLWPRSVGRAFESSLVDALAAGTTRPEDWRPLGPAFFMAGLAVTLASVPGLDRPGYLDLAEALHPGATEPRVYARWLAQTPLSPSRFLPMLLQKMRHAA